MHFSIRIFQAGLGTETNGQKHDQYYYYINYRDDIIRPFCVTLMQNSITRKVHMQKSQKVYSREFMCSKVEKFTSRNIQKSLRAGKLKKKKRLQQNSLHAGKQTILQSRMFTCSRVEKFTCGKVETLTSRNMERFKNHKKFRHRKVEKVYSRNVYMQEGRNVYNRKVHIQQSRQFYSRFHAAKQKGLQQRS